MKDIVDNRQRITLPAKIRLALIALKENRILWLIYLAIYYLGSSVANFGFNRADALRKRHNLPGVNSRNANKHIWEHWDWSGGGEEWTPSAEWKASVVKTFIDPYFSTDYAVLEIGPGGGRWTQYLLPRAKTLTAVDISETCVQTCKSKFGHYKHADFVVGNGRDLAMLDDRSIDRIWSFDVFVHINASEFASYISEFARVLQPGGLGVIQHGSSGGATGGWRSNVTLSDVTRFLADNGLGLEDQLQSWVDEGREYQAGLYSDVITIFKKP
ncbi:MAG: methyltransferase domain-containing protein [Gammaproteobacteria bacterium]